MIYLIAKMFVYLLLAGGIGGVAGWLVRNLQAQKSEEQAQRGMHDAKSKLPQLESLLRGRDEQISKLKQEVTERKAEYAELEQQQRNAEQEMREQQRELNRLKQAAESKSEQSLDEFSFDQEQSEQGGETDALIAELSAEITRLKDQLQQSPPVAVSDDNGDQLKRVQGELRQTSAELRQEQSKVTELERERELQNKSLQVLHQQLELERMRTAANG